MGREDAKLLERVFSHFIKKLRMTKPDDKLLELLPVSHSAVFFSHNKSASARNHPSDMVYDS
jgi:hypothetical protein